MIISDPAIREAWRKFKHTRPTELPCTTWLLKRLGLRKTKDIDNQDNNDDDTNNIAWSEKIDTDYQAGSVVTSYTEISPVSLNNKSTTT